MPALPTAYPAYTFLSSMATDPSGPDSFAQTELVPKLPRQSPNHKPESQHREDAPATYPLSRQFTTTSHVHIGFFDPEGVERLRRRLSRQSQSQLTTPLHPKPSAGHGQKKHSTHSVSSELTLAITDGSFDLEKTLRNFMKKYVTLPELSGLCN